jgi:hypothetical protein
MSQEIEFTLKIDGNDANVVMAGLLELQAKVSVNTMFKIRQQLDAQIAAANTPKAEPEKAAPAA